MRYPYEVFVDVAALQRARGDVFEPCYRLARMDTETVDNPNRGGWGCSHFYTMAPSILTTNMDAHADGRVRLLCEQEPYGLPGTDDQTVQFNLLPDELHGECAPMICRVEVSGQQIRNRNPNPICVFVLDSNGSPEAKQWCSHVEFPTAVFGNRSGDVVWLETYYDFNVGVTRADA